jgi:hypothetical protein
MAIGFRPDGSPGKSLKKMNSSYLSDALVSKVVLRCGHVLRSENFGKSLEYGTCVRENCRTPLEPNAAFCIKIYADKWKMK